MLTEHRAGTYIFCDVMTVAAGAATWDNCAMRVRATVVSRPTAERAVFDCGTKVLTSDQYTVDRIRPRHGVSGRRDPASFGGARRHRSIEISQKNPRSAK